MKILKLTAENLKKIRAVEITPDGALVQISGRNGSGKTSVLDAIYCALAGKSAFDPEPVRRGEDVARITLDLGEIIVRRTITADGKTTLVVEAENGARFPSPQAMLDKLLGALTFDPLEFMAMTPIEQEGQLRKLVTLDVDLDVLEGQNRAAFENRTAMNRRVKELEGQLAAFATLPELPARVESVSELLSEMERAGADNVGVEREHARRGTLKREIEEGRIRTLDMRARAARLVKDAEGLEAQLADASEQFAALPSPPTFIEVREITARVEQARADAALVKQHGERKALHQKLDLAVAESAALTEGIKQRNAARTAAIAGATMPVPGLSFGDGLVSYHGLPLAQASDAEQLRVSVGIAIATNPKLRVLRVRNGSLLDSKGMALLAAMVEDHDWQCWIECVDESGKVGIVMEDGMVVAVNGETAEVAA